MLLSGRRWSMNIVKVRFRTNDEFDAHYQKQFECGGLFCPTTKPLDEDSEVVIELSVPALPNKVLIRGLVRSWRPALPRLRVRAGAMVEFLPEEAPKRDFVVETLGGIRVPTGRRKHTRLPVDIAVRYRNLAHSEGFIESKLIEISVGGALLDTSEPIPIGSDIILELTPPGAVSPIAISGKVAYHGHNGRTGLKFVYRDSGGSRRLRELIRRLREA